MNEHRKILSIACLCLLSFAATASAFELGGYYKNFSVAIDPAPNPVYNISRENRLQGELRNRLRLNLSLELLNGFDLRLSYDLVSRIISTSGKTTEGAFFASIPRKYRIADIDRYLYPCKNADEAGFSVLENLDRLLIGIRTGLVDIFIGRQAVSWGSSRAINPTDIITPFTFDDLDTEDRIGVDALRVRIPLQTMGELDIGYVLGKRGDFSKSAIFLRTALHLFKTDISIIAMSFRENLLLGFDLARSLGQAGAWMEAAYVNVDALAENPSSGARDYTRITLGSDYNLRSNLYGFLEYHLSSAGALEPEKYLDILSRRAFEEGSLYLLGRHYLVPGLRWSVTPLISMQLESLWNIADSSVFLIPKIEYTPFEDIYLELGAFVGLGRDYEDIKGMLQRPLSEFGIYPDLYYTSFRLYF